jgi:hypothetical protein
MRPPDASVPQVAGHSSARAWASSVEGRSSLACARRAPRYSARGLSARTDPWLDLSTGLNQGHIRCLRSARRDWGPLPDEAELAG